jgi:hypothetical protein
MSMSDDVKRFRLTCIKDAMDDVMRAAEVIAGNVRELEAAGVELPAMRETATTLAQVALGWARLAEGIGPG